MMVVGMVQQKLMVVKLMSVQWQQLLLMMVEVVWVLIVVVMALAVILAKHGQLPHLPLVGAACCCCEVEVGRP